jgi:Tfp pilus assembly protein FimT
MLTPSRRQTGVTIVELLIAVALLSLLVGIGVPTFRSWIQNSQVRTGADALLNGVQLARAEAIRRNKPVEFILRQGRTGVVLVNPRTSAGPQRQLAPRTRCSTTRRPTAHLQPDRRACGQQPGRVTPHPGDRDLQLEGCKRIAQAEYRDLGLGERPHV